MITDLLHRYPRTLGWYLAIVYTAAVVGDLWPR